MDIFLSINNREQVIQLPVVPSEFKITRAMSHETFSTIGQGDIRLLGQKGLQSIAFDSFFPGTNYSFLRNRKYKRYDYIKIIEKWIDRRVPIRLIITGTPINLPMTIDSFEYGPQDGTRDIYYSLKLTEFKFIQLAKKKV